MNQNNYNDSDINKRDHVENSNINNNTNDYTLKENMQYNNINNNLINKNISTNFPNNPPNSLNNNINLNNNLMNNYTYPNNNEYLSLYQQNQMIGLNNVNKNIENNIMKSLKPH